MSKPGEKAKRAPKDSEKGPRDCEHCGEITYFDPYEYHCWVCEYCDFGKPRGDGMDGLPI